MLSTRMPPSPERRLFGKITLAALAAIFCFAANSRAVNYVLTVNGGTGGGSYAAGTIVNIAAGAAQSGYEFTGWTGTTAALVISDASSSSATITMPAVATTVTASYGLIPTTYTVTVTNGTVSNTTGSSYPAGAKLVVTANAPASGYYFSGWTGTTSALANPSFCTTVLTVPAGAATVTANYTAGTATYAVTVTNGSGGGSYAPGTAVSITANAPAAGYQFAGWTGSTSALACPAAPATTLFVPSAAAAVTATYTPISSAGTLILAVGLERIVPGYNGSAIRIRRSSDNTEEDIGFAAGSNNLDTAAVTAFLGQTQGWITTLYAQDGSGHNLTTPMPTSTETMPTIWVTAPTTLLINGSPNLTARNVAQPFAYEQGNLRYFVLPPSVAVNKSQTSAFLAFRPDYSGSGNGNPYMSLYEVGNPTTDAVDAMVCSSGYQGLSHNSDVTYSNTNVNSRSQQTVLGLVTSPTNAPTLYLDGVGHSSGGSVPPSVSCQGGYLMAGTGTGNYFGIPLDADYNFLAFALYSGTVSASQAASISSALLPRPIIPAYNIAIDGDSITQGTGSIYGWNMVHYLQPLLNEPADITNLAVYGAPSASALGHVSSPTAATSGFGMSYSSSIYSANIYYVDIGTNDIHADDFTGASAWSNVEECLQDAKAIGYKTIVATLLHENGESSAQSTQVDDFNALARAAVGQPYLDAIADFEADPRLGITSNYYPAYSVDGTHPNEAGYQIMSTIAAPVFNQFIPVPPVLASAASVQSHAGTPYGIALPLTGSPGVECRAINGALKVVFTFEGSMISGTASVVAGTATVNGAPTFSGDTMTVNLSGVTDAQSLTVEVASLNGTRVSAEVTFTVLLGDVNGDGAVNSQDLVVVRNDTGAVSGGTGFNPAADVNEDGAVNSQDLVQVRNHAGAHYP